MEDRVTIRYKDRQVDFKYRYLEEQNWNLIQRCMQVLLMQVKSDEQSD